MPRDVRASAFPRWETTSTAQPFRVTCETLDNDPHSLARIPGNYPGRHIGKMLHTLRQQFRLDVTGPWNMGENLRFCRPWNPIPPYLRSQDGESARYHAAADPTRPRRRGDRIARFAAVAHVRLWQKADITTDRTMSAFGGRADIGVTLCNVPLLTQSG